MYVLVVCQDPRADAIARRVGELASCYRVSVGRWGTNFYLYVGDGWELVERDVPRRFELVFLHEADAEHCEDVVLRDAGVVVRFTTPGLTDEAAANVTVIERLQAAEKPGIVQGVELALVEPFPHDAILCPIMAADVTTLLGLATGKSTHLPRCCLSGSAADDVQPLLALGVLLEGWLLLNARDESDEGAQPLFGTGGWFDEALLAGTNPGNGGALQLVWDLVAGGGRCSDLDATMLDREELQRLFSVAHDEFESSWHSLGSGWVRAAGSGAG